MTVPHDVQEVVRQVTGATLGPVQARTGRAVQQAASGMQADAFTVDGIVHLPTHAAQAHSDEERRVLAHELTHVAQQRRMGSTLPHESTPHGQALEAEALRAEELLSPRQASTPSASAGAVVAGAAGAGVPAPSPTRTAGAPAPTPAIAPGQAIDRSRTAGVAAVAGARAAGRAASEVELTPRSMPAAMDARAGTAAALTSRPGAVATSPSGAPVMTGSRSTSAGPAPSSAGGGTAGEGVQRRATSSPAPSSSATSPSSPPPTPSAAVDTTRDQQWLERHAEALYPLIRQQLRAELFRDRERRGRLMREP